MAAPNVVTSPQTNAVIAPVSNQANPNVQPVVQGAQAFRLLGVAKGVNVNATGDQAIIPIINCTAYSVFQVVMTNASISLSAALAGVFTAPNGGGTAIVANAALSGLTGPSIVSQRTVASTAQVGPTVSAPLPLNLYVNVGTAQGAAATVDVLIYGYDLSA
jgi:hypothetical protein